MCHAEMKVKSKYTTRTNLKVIKKGEEKTTGKIQIHTQDSKLGTDYNVLKKTYGDSPIRSVNIMIACELSSSLFSNIRIYS